MKALASISLDVPARPKRALWTQLKSHFDPSGSKSYAAGFNQDVSFSPRTTH
jgi:hypothetical protein